MSGVLIGEPIINGLSMGLLGGLGIGSLDRITLVETMSWKWNRFWKRSILGSIVGLIFGPIFGPSVGLSVGLIFGLLGGLVSGLVGGFTDSVKVGKAFPNQGIKLSLRNSLAVFLVTWLTVWLIVWLIFALSVGLNVGLSEGLTGGLIVGLNRGGSAVIKHYVLRLTLWRSGYTPFKFIKFLDHCARLILLKKVGGGYIFIHRMLLEYFAVLTPQSPKAEDRQKAKGVRRELGQDNTAAEHL
jgi:hypothetical protein